MVRSYTSFCEACNGKVFELCMPLFLASFGSVDYSKDKPLGTSFLWQIHLHKLHDRGISCLRVVALCLRHCGKADFSVYVFSVLIFLYLRVG